METFFGQIEQARGHLARERALNDLRALARDAEDLLKVTAHVAGETTGAARSRVATALERAKSTIAELQAQAVATASTAARKADTVVRKHPYESIGVAFGVGLLAGLLAVRGSRGMAEEEDSAPD